MAFRTCLMGSKIGEIESFHKDSSIDNGLEHAFRTIAGGMSLEGFQAGIRKDLENLNPKKTDSDDNGEFSAMAARDRFNQRLQSAWRTPPEDLKPEVIAKTDGYQNSRFVTEKYRSFCSRLQNAWKTGTL